MPLTCLHSIKATSRRIALVSQKLNTLSYAALTDSLTSTGGTANFSCDVIFHGLRL